MALYINKGSEELSAILNAYKENYKQRFGSYPDDLTQKLSDKLKEQQEKHFNSVFGQLTPSDLATLLKIMTEPIENEKESKKSIKLKENKPKQQEKA